MTTTSHEIWTTILSDGVFIFLLVVLTAGMQERLDLQNITCACARCVHVVCMLCACVCTLCVCEIVEL